MKELLLFIEELDEIALHSVLSSERREVGEEVSAAVEPLHRGGGFHKQVNRILVSPVARVDDAGLSVFEVNGNGIFGVISLALHC